MAEVVNLRRARKARDREAERARAAEQRARHGRTKAERDATARRTARDEAHLDGARLEPDGER